MAFSSALVGKYLGGLAKSRRTRLEQAVKAQERWAEEETKYRDLVKTLRDESQEALDEALKREDVKAARITTLNASLEIISGEVEKERLAAKSAISSMQVQGQVHAKERNAWEAEKKELLAENQRLENKIAAEAASATQAATVAHEAAIASLRAEVETLSKKVSDDAEAAKRLTCQIGAEAVMAYKYTEDFLGDMSDFQIAAVSILKKALVKDGKISAEEASLYDYETCLERDAQGEFADM